MPTIGVDPPGPPAPTVFAFFKPNPPEPLSPSDPLDEPLLFFGEGDPFTRRDSFEGVQIFGGIGSGKTSGSGSKFAQAFLRAGYGGLVLTAKPDETDLWRTYAEISGRRDDLLIVSRGGAFHFDPIRYELDRNGPGKGETENVVRLFDALVEVGSRLSPSKAGGEDPFWPLEQRKLIRNAVDLLRLAGMPVSLQAVYATINSAALTAEDLNSAEWRERSDCYLAILRATERGERGELTPTQLDDFRKTFDFWCREYPTKPNRTRSTVLAIFTGMADVLLRGTIRELFSGENTFTPEDSFAGKIIVMDLPILRDREVGLLAQGLFKYCWQRTVEGRRTDGASRPVFLWADEAQYFVNQHDVAFQTTARSARVATVFLTQNVPNYLMSLGRGAEPFVDSLLGNLVTKVFHNNTCAHTNKYAAELFARDWREKRSDNFSMTQERSTFGNSVGRELEYIVQPKEFTDLKKGGPENEWIVEGIVHQGGKTFATSGLNALCVQFLQ